MERAELEMKEEQLIVETCMLGGKIMMQSGAETYRVEDTMMRMAACCGFPRSESFCTPTGIIFSLGKSRSTHFVRISSRGTDLEKIARVNEISRNMSSGQVSTEAAFEALNKLEYANLMYPVWLQILASAIVSASFLIMFKGVWSDFLPALIVSGTGFAVHLFTNHVTKVKFFAEFTGAFTIGLLGVLFVSLGLGKQLDIIVIASVMPLVPGLLITNAIRDLMAGHFVSGLSKGAEAFLTAFAIGAGVAVVYSFWL